jgi:hypothetical protein
LHACTRHCLCNIWEGAERWHFRFGHNKYFVA